MKYIYDIIKIKNRKMCTSKKWYMKLLKYSKYDKIYSEK